MQSRLKQQAKSLIKGKIGSLFVVMLVYIVICFAIMIIPSFMTVSESTLVALLGNILSIVASLAVMPIAMGYYLVYLDVAKGQEVAVRRLFDGFNYFVKVVILTILVGVFTCLWTLLFIVPGIIKSFSYSQAFFILAENPDMRPIDAITESRRMMDGHKWEYFVLSLSFILWILLCYVTCGIAMIYVMPYMTTTLVLFYLKLKGDDVVDTTATTMEM
jgi:uncharacterized membrane protein